SGSRKIIADTWPPCELARSDSFRLAVTPSIPDDGKTPDGKPKVLKKAMGTKEGKKGKPDLDELKQEVDMVR
ncbi:hypothetical protein TNCT_562731, partial [Trichonephila clavata]